MAAVTAAAVELVGRLAWDRPITAELVAEVDPLVLGGLVADFAHLPALTGAADTLRRSVRSEASAAPSSSVVQRVSPSLFVLALLREDPQVLDWAAEVDPVALALFALVVLEWPAVTDPVPWLERYALAERGDL